MTTGVKKALAAIPTLAWIGVLAIALLSFLVRDRNSLGADAQAFDTLATLRGAGAIVLLVTGIALTLFVYRPRILPFAGTGLFTLAMFVCFAQGAFLRGETLSWAAYAVGVLCGVAASLHLSRSLGAAEEARSRLQREYGGAGGDRSRERR